MVKVSVCIITYNHKPFIAQALDSVLMQKTDFNYEIVLGEDESQDGTREISIEYSKRYPERIRLFLRSRKDVLYINGRPTGRFNLVESLKAAQGEYITLLEGDDYWIDPYKLQKQVDFLEQHPEYVLITNNAFVVREEEDFAVAHLMKKQIDAFDFGTAELMVSNPCITLTVMFRNHRVTEFPEIYFEGTGGDRRLFLLLSLHGKCRYINDVVGVYRKHASGLSTRKGTLAGKLESGEETIRNAENWNRYLGGQYQAEENFVRHRVSLDLVAWSLRSWKLRKAIQYSRSVNLEDIQNQRTRLVVRLLKSMDRALPTPKTSD